MSHREFIRYMGIAGGSGSGSGSGSAIVISIGLSGCAVAPVDKPASASVAGGVAPLAYGTPKQRTRMATDTPRMVVVFLHGAVNSLNAVVPHGDREYYQARSCIAVARPGQNNGAIDLTVYFDLHPRPYGP